MRSSVIIMTGLFILFAIYTIGSTAVAGQGVIIMPQSREEGMRIESIVTNPMVMDYGNVSPSLPTEEEKFTEILNGWFDDVWFDDSYIEP